MFQIKYIKYLVNFTKKNYNSGYSDTFYLSYYLLTLFQLYFYNTDYYEPPCKSEADCQPAWNIYFVVKCVDNLCKWVKLQGIYDEPIRRFPFDGQTLETTKGLYNIE